MIEEMITKAVLQDHFSPVLHKIAGEQDAYARRTNAMNITGNVLIGAGSAVLAFAAHSTKVAGVFDQIKKSMIATVGAQQAAFDTKYVDQFAQHSSQTYLNLSLAAGKLDAQHVSVSGHLQDMADIAAGTGASVGELSQIYDRLLAGGKTGTALGQQGFPRFGFSTKDIFEEAGLAYKPGQKVQGKITPEEADAAIHRLIQKKGWHGLDTKQATTTIKGASSMLEDAVTRFEKGVGDANLGATITLLNNLAGSINSVATAMEDHPTLTKAVEGSAGAALLVGGILKGVAAWREYKAIVGAVKTVAAAERAGDAAKVPIAGAEAGAIGKSTGAYSALRGMLIRTGTATLGEGAAAAGVTRILAAGIGTVGLYGVALGGLAFDIGLVVKSFDDLNKASRDFEASTAALNKAKAQGYDFKAVGGQPTGYAALPVWKQYGEEFVNGVAGFATYGKYTPFDTNESGSTAMTDAASNALAKKHGRPYNGVTATLLREQAAQRAATAEARRESAKEAAAAAGEAAGKYELPPDFQYKLEHDKRQFDYLNRIDPDSKREEAARKTEIEDLMKARDLLLEKAKIATDPKDKYQLMGEADEYDFEAQNMDVTKEKKDKKNKLDKTIAKILGADGLSAAEVLKQSGVGGAFIANLKKPGGEGNSLSKALKTIASRPMVLNLQLDNKPFAQIKAQIKDEIFRDLEKVMSGSSPRAIFGGN